MNQPLRLAGAAALCAALLLTGCAKKTDQTTTSSDTTSTQAGADAGASPAAGAAAATAVPDAGTTPAAATAPSTAPDSSATTAASNGSGGGFITLPVYPGATAAETGSISTSSNTGSVDIKMYQTKDDAKKVVDWYKAHLPSSFQNFTISADGKTTGTFSDEHKDGSGDQSVVVTTDQSTNQTRIQLATKHGK